MRRPPPRRPPRPPAAPGALRRRLIAAAIAVAVGAMAIVAGVLIVHRIQTGRWDIPDTDDVVRIVRGGRDAPSRTIFLERRAIVLRPGRDDAARGMSSVLASAGDRPARVPGWRGSDGAWRRVVRCVQDLFAPFDVVVTDVRPAHDDFVLVAIGGRPRDIGMKDRRVGGLAPFDGDVIARPVVFAFAAALNHDVRAVCETIGMEVAHAYGLDHGYECKDVMTYLTGCGAKRFVDRDVRCGERRRRDCEGGAPTQNSYRHLIRVLGPRR